MSVWWLPSRRMAYHPITSVAFTAGPGFRPAYTGPVSRILATQAGLMRIRANWRAIVTDAKWKYHYPPEGAKFAGEGERRRFYRTVGRSQVERLRGPGRLDRCFDRALAFAGMTILAFLMAGGVIFWLRFFRDLH